MKLRDIVERLGCRLEGGEGAGDLEITRVATLEAAEPGDLSFLTNARYHSLLATTRASAVIVDSSAPVDPAGRFAIVRSDHPYVTLARILRLFLTPAVPASGIDRTAVVAPDATVGLDARIGPYAVVGAGATVGARAVIHPHVVIGPEARIGDDCVLHAGVSIRERVVIGHRVTILDGAVIGSDGFGFAKQPDGAHLKIPQHAAVVVEDDVEIGANTTIDRPAVGETRIGAGTKIDNLVQIAHGVRIGPRSLVAAQVGIAGSAIIGEEVTLGGQVGVNGHIRIGRGAMASGKTGVTRDVAPGVLVSGYPSLPNAEWRKAQVLVRHLPELKKRIEALERLVVELKERLAECQKRLIP